MLKSNSKKVILKVQQHIFNNAVDYANESLGEIKAAEKLTWLIYREMSKVKKVWEV